MLVLVMGSPVAAAAKAPAVMQPPDEKTLANIREKTEQLGKEVAALRQHGVPDWELADVEVFHKAGIWIVAHDEWYKDYAKWTGTVLETGLKRAGELRAGKTRWLERQGTVYHGYRSALDGSVQPYKVILPKDYPGTGKQWRLDLILHGRDDTLDEVKFLHAGDSTGPAPDQEYVELHVMGRGENAYRWAGERDVYEALAAFREQQSKIYGREMIDSNRIVLRGFSMGGAGAWHLGLRNPSMWCSVSPGAGFTTTYGRVKNPDGKLPDYQVKCLGIYDALDYAENVFDVPVVAYGGEIDAQREAMESIRDKITPLGLHATFLVGPKMGHKYDPASLKEIMRLQGEQAVTGLLTYPNEVRFVTMTPRNSSCFWVSVLRQEHQYVRSSISARKLDDSLRIRTENVQTLSVSVPAEWRKRAAIPFEIDGHTLSIKPEYVCVVIDKSGSGWTQSPMDEWFSAAESGKWKTSGLTGPIDDAFTRQFLCVRGTRKPWHDEVQKHADAELARFSREWNQWFRGELPVKNDSDVTAIDMLNKDVVLFGDPSSNSMIAEALPHLPLKWTNDELTMDGKTYPAAGHVPAIIYPNPLSRGRYIVLNSGHTFHDADFKSTNRMLYPRLGDWAMLSVSAGEKDPADAQVVAAGLFDEEWRWPATPH
jgi:hypothetical protein